MQKFKIEDDFWQLFPKAKIGVIVCKGIDNTNKDKQKYEKMISKGRKEALEYLNYQRLSINPVVKVWRDVFKKFKTKKGARSSIEALLKRVKKGKNLWSINPLVDIYNSISLKYGLPCGGEDINKFSGDLRLTKAEGNEQFVPLGRDKNSSPYEEEIIYKDDEGAVCRCWNWREAERTKLTEDTKDAFLIIELVDEKREDEFKEALKELSAKVKDNLGGSNSITILDKENEEVIINKS